MTVPARTPGTGTDQAPGPTATAPDDEPAVALVEPPSAEELVESAVATWRATLVEAAGGSTLADVDLLGDAALDLSAAHPSGMAQLFAGRETRLSNLVREAGAQATARRRARAVGARAAAYAQRYGIAPTSLAIGVATWVEHGPAGDAHDDMGALAAATRGPAPAPDATAEAGSGAAPVTRTVRAPVLLRPVTLTARGSGESDYELVLEPTVEVNPVLARALRRRGALLDADAVARGTFSGGGFDPRAALRRLASLGEAVLEDFALGERVIVGTFLHPGQVLVDDLDALAGTLERHEVVAALAGVDAQRQALRAPLPEPVVGDRDPAAERGVGDLDPAQQHILDVVGTGAHVFVDAPTGADVTGTLAAMVADAAAAGRTVLHVPGHRRSAVALAARLDALGLGDLLLDVAPAAGWRSQAARRLLGAMTLEQPEVDEAGLRVLRGELVARRERLRAYVDALHAERRPWGVSAYDALQQLARLTSTRPTPRTTVRLPVDVARVLDDERRAALADDLAAAGRLGAFRLRPTDTPWYGADLRTAADAEVAVRRIERLLDTGLPTLTERIAQVAAETGLTPPTTLAGWAEQLRLLDGVRQALDVFQPLVFERTAADLVAATASSAWRAEHGVTMGYWLRRRLRKQAKDMVRPGRPVADLHAALLDVQARREAWQAQCPSGGWPRLPDGLQHIEEEHRALRLDVDALEEVLAGTPAGGGLAGLPLTALTERLGRLRADTAGLDRLPERNALLHRLRSAGLGDLVDDLAARRVDADVAPAELDLAWWSTVIEQILGDDPALAGYDGSALGALSAEYAALDRSHVDSLAGPVRAAVVGHVQGVLRQHREQAEALFAELVEERLTSLRDTVARYPDVARRLRPVLAASPMLVPQVLPPARVVDLVVIDSAAHLPLEVVLSAVARARQVVVVGDARSASGSAVRELATVLPTVALRAGASRRDPYLTTFLADHGYAGVLTATPLPQQRPLVSLDVVDGTGMPDQATGTVQSTRAEVEQVVELVLNHALMRAEESLAVVTASAVHADAVREAVLGEVRGNPALAAFFDASRSEPFVVTELSNVAGLRRDAVILSLGFGRTPHGRVLHTFGPLSAPGGEGLLLDALGATRQRLAVVSCFGAEDLDEGRLRGAGPQLLRDLLELAAWRGAGGTAAPGADESAADETAVAETAADESAADESAADESAAAEAVADGEPVPAADEPVPAGAGDSASAGTSEPASAGADEPDRLLLDLAERLWRHGLVVELGYGIPGGARIPMVVGHPAVPGEMLVAVLTDDAAYVDEPSVRVRERLTADRLEHLGWSVVRVWSAAAFLDPQAEVDRIRRAVHARVPAEVSPRTAPLVLGVPEVVDGPDGDEDVPSAAGSARAAAPAGVGAALGASGVDATAAGDPAGAASTAASAGTAVRADVQDAATTEPAARTTAAPGAAAPGAAAPAAAAPDGTSSGDRVPGTPTTNDAARSEVVAGGAASDGTSARASSAGEVRARAATAGAGDAQPVGSGGTQTAEVPVPEAPEAVAPETATSATMTAAGASATADAAGTSTSASETSASETSASETSASEPPATGAAASVDAPRLRAVPPARAEQPTLEVRTLPRPDVRRGLPIGAYSDDQLDELVTWLRSDGRERTRDELAAALREELGVTRRSYRIDTAVRAAITRALSGSV